MNSFLTVVKLGNMFMEIIIRCLVAPYKQPKHHTNPIGFVVSYTMLLEFCYLLITNRIMK